MSTTILNASENLGSALLPVIFIRLHHHSKILCDLSPGSAFQFHAYLKSSSSMSPCCSAAMAISLSGLAGWHLLISSIFICMCTSLNIHHCSSLSSQESLGADAEYLFVGVVLPPSILVRLLWCEIQNVRQPRVGA